MKKLALSASVALIAGSLALAGCASSSHPQLGSWDGPSSAAQVASANWNTKTTGVTLRTAHYTIYTTLTNGDVLRMLPQVMEGALAEYQNLMPDLPLTQKPMDCYVFETHAQWAEFTSRFTGDDAKIYLQINRGGYTLRDWYVSYYIGDAGTYSVASHEGWHQFVARHFKNRIPPFLEEGLACTFETVQYRGDLPRWNRTINTNRCLGLRHAIDSNSLYPLEKLVSMNAGQVVDKTNNRIEAFYSQAWAFARFLHDSDHGKYRPALQALLSDIAAGRASTPQFQWNPHIAKALFERYLQMPFSQIEQEYQQYIKYLADTELASQYG